MNVRRPDLQVLLAKFRAGHDTMQIADAYGLTEAAVYNGIHYAREGERRRRLNCERTRKYYAAHKHEIKLRRCGVTETPRQTSPRVSPTLGAATGGANAAFSFPSVSASPPRT